MIPMRKAAVFATAEAAEDAFYDAMQKGDALAMMALWADDDDVACIHPSGPRLVGMAAIGHAYDQIFDGGGVNVRTADVRMHQGAMVAVHTLIEQVIIAGRGGSQVIECAATNVYVKTANGWRMVLHHASPLGEGGDGSGRNSPMPGPAVLH